MIIFFLFQSHTDGAGQFHVLFPSFSYSYLVLRITSLSYHSRTFINTSSFMSFFVFYTFIFSSDNHLSFLPLPADIRTFFNTDGWRGTAFYCRREADASGKGIAGM